MEVGILALQGDVGVHTAALVGLGVRPVEVRGAAELERVDALILPGGESTTLSLLLASADLVELLGARLDDGMPALGTCAGMILLARRVLDGRPDQVALGAVDIDVRRNAFGRQVDSFEIDLEVVSLPGGPLHAVFIRAPFVERAGRDVAVLASVADAKGHDHPVLCRQGAVVAAAFHPELSGDTRLHQLFLEQAATTKGR